MAEQIRSPLARHPLDVYLRSRILEVRPEPVEGPRWAWPLFEAQAASRHLDLVARELQRAGRGFYTISSAGHESNALVAMALRPTDPALLHYRSGGF